MIYPLHFRLYIIRPVLKKMAARTGIRKLWTLAAENLVLGTCLVESDLFYLAQYPRGPARGIAQMEWDTYSWVLSALAEKHQEVYLSIFSFASDVDEGWTPWEQVRGNMFLSVALCRGRYWLDKEPLPPAKNIEALGAYWKRVWNTDLGKGTVRDFVQKYKNQELA